MKLKLLILILLTSIGVHAQTWEKFNAFGLERKIVSGDTTWRFVGSGTNGVRLFSPDGITDIDTTQYRTVGNSYSLAGMQTKLNGYVPTTRLVSTSGGLLGGGNLGSNLSLSADTSVLRTVANSLTKAQLQTKFNLYTPTSGLGSLAYLNNSSGVTLSVNTTGNATTSTLASEAVLWNGFAYNHTPLTAVNTYLMGYDGGGVYRSTPKVPAQTFLDINNGATLINNVTGNAGTVTNGVYTSTFNGLGDARYLLLTEKGANSGLATLDGSGKVPLAQLPTGADVYKGTWNANTNTPTLIDGTGTAGWYYYVDVAGTQNLGSGSITYAIGDRVSYNGTTWQKVPNFQAVNSVNGYQGTIVLVKGDIGLGSVDNTPDISKPISTLTQTALDGKAPLNGVGTSGSWPINAATASIATQWNGFDYNHAPTSTIDTYMMVYGGSGTYRSATAATIQPFLSINDASTLNNSVSGNAATVTNGVYTSTFNGLGDARYILLSNLSTNTSLGSSNTLVPSQNAVKTYVDAAVSAGGLGTVLSVGLSAPTGFSVSGSPVTSSGTLAFSFTAGYSLPTIAKQTEWDAAYTDRNKWDGGATGLSAGTARNSLGGTTVGQNFFTATNPSAITFPRINADNTVDFLNATAIRAAIGAGAGTLTSITPGTGFTSSTPITSAGTLNVNVGTGANQILQRTATGAIQIGVNSGTELRAINTGQDIGYYAGTSGQGAHYWYTDNGVEKMRLTTAGNLTVVGNVSVPDDAYGIAWNSNPDVPTKNAIYDKIQSLPSAFITLVTTSGTSGPAGVVSGVLNIPNYSSSLALGTATSTTYPITNTNGTGVTLPSATTSVAGLMSAPDKTLFDGATASATASTLMKRDGSGEVSVANIYVTDAAYGSGWNGNGQTPTKNAIYDKIESMTGAGSSGTYTPTVSDNTNCSSFSISNAHYIRIGNEVTVFGRIQMTVTASASVQLNLSLPIASNIGVAQDASGLSTTNDGLGGIVIGDGATNDVTIGWTSGSSTSISLNYSFTYTVI